MKAMDEKIPSFVPTGYYGTVHKLRCTKCGLVVWVTPYFDAEIHEPYKGGCQGRWADRYVEDEE